MLWYNAAKTQESFGQAFSKACAVEAAEASSPSAEGEIPYTAFSFARQIRVAICGELASLFSSCAYFLQEKSD
jgi:hypothetical protein